MKVYESKQIRNVVLLGHGGVGKTMVAEALSFVTGAISKMGSIEAGNTLSDFDKEEQKHGFSISSALVPIEFKGEDSDIKINIIDTPGYFDFVGQVEEAISVADAAIIVINCKAGIEVGTIKAFNLCEKYRLPRLFFVTNMDDDKASYRELILKLDAKFGRKVAPFHLPIRENEHFVGYVNVVKMKGRRYTKFSDYDECEIPDYSQANLKIARESLMEAIAETNEEYMERYFSGDEFSFEEIDAAIRENVSKCQIYPVLMGSGTQVQGFKSLLRAIDKYFPSPDFRTEDGIDVSTGEHFTANANPNVTLSVKVWKTMVDPFIGKYSFVKVCTGTLDSDTGIYNVLKEQEEKTGKIYTLRGKDLIELPKLVAGDIGALAKLNITDTGDTLASKMAPILYHRPKISKPYTYMRYKSMNKGDEDKLAIGLSKIMEEDLTIKTLVDNENRQSLIYGIGEQQLEIVRSKLRYRIIKT